MPSAADSQVWSLRLPNAGKDGEPGRLAWIAVYVDDISTMGPRAFGLAIVNKVKNTWETGWRKKFRMYLRVLRLSLGLRLEG